MAEQLSSINMTKILATIGPATLDPNIIEEMILAGTDCFRINFSHATEEQAASTLAMVRRAAQKHNRQVGVLQDLQGPKIRCGSFDGEVRLEKDSTLELIYGDIPATPTQMPIQYDLSQRVKVDELIYIFDGKIKTVVTAVEPQKITVRVLNTGVTTQKKGLNLPDTDFSGAIITEKDKKDIQFGLTQDYDYVALSFVQKADDINELRQMLKVGGSDAKIMAKIETKLGVENLEAIVKASDAVMVARGDLATEVSPEAVPVIQRRIVKLCQKYGKISIVATQMMASMVERPNPTRAEVSDVANAAMNGADAVMLSDETAMGKYPVETVRMMKSVIDYSIANEPVAPLYNKLEDHSVQSSITSGVITLSHQVQARAIVAETKSGATALSISAHRPSMPLIAVTSLQRTANQLALTYGVSPYVRPDGEKAGEKLTDFLIEQNILSTGDTIVSASGRYPGQIGFTDTIKVRQL